MSILQRVSFALLLVTLIAISQTSPAHAFSPPVLVKENVGGGQLAPLPCPLTPSLSGSCANYRWYNTCSGYIWSFNMDAGESVGVLFGGPDQPCVVPGNTVKRVITYFLSTFPSYGGVKVFLHRDNEGDGCPEGVLAASGAFYPANRWNCSEFNTVIPPGLTHVIVRQMQDWLDAPDRQDARGKAFAGQYSFSTDGPNESCDPFSVARSFYYGIGNNPTACEPWAGPTGRPDNFLTWLIVDGTTTAVEPHSWGQIKGLFQ